ncbi:glycoside hydrolase family 3 C-terminal domain-containing protein [Mucilaginibacter sp. BJC16-A38]|uniref:glycoside hydrolase family 3 C-terminal domain-containing protein n=1 Tax=Mucilaginibacter phenanthrenivorans TaxID=1234842 RepID=UPI002157E40D|nr:glycoside hydrolase family 3 C-terminal domain-containing protein [Mucilaginibacter phenanthrenivorans]MCR8556508.1 glycoside hydrolase family 3 C-terminal domain-containing protein [Mucilaginibacter phenanthrenivorans]
MKIPSRICALAAIIMPLIAAAQTPQYPYQDYKLDFNIRVNDLVKRMTLEEKVSQMLNSSPAIPRLGIPAYDWWNEVLHGVARTPFKVTVYPQAIAMAATFDQGSLNQMADYAALEGRAVHNKALQMGRAGERYMGLTYWTPNINIFRDPRWGRGQETYGEDPFLTAAMGSAFVKGLQGDDPKYLKAAACAKHYAVHSGPEPSRHIFNADVSDYDLWDTYLPAFKKLVVDAKVAGVMCAYNAFKRQPCCGSDLLMVNILRNQWNFSGYVTSDCWGIDDFFKNHKTHANAEDASADAVLHGTDVECGTDAFKSLVAAVKDGRIAETQIDVSVRRLFMTRFRLGMFDPPKMVKYAQTPASTLESPAHRELALKMARQAIVLLKNAGQTLPLSKSIKKVVVLGPNADNPIAILGNYNGIPSAVTTVFQGIRQKLPNAAVSYEKAVNFTNDTMLVYANVAQQYHTGGHQGFRAEYFNNRDLKGEPVVRYEDTVAHVWQEDEEVAGTIKARDFSARYSTTFSAHGEKAVTFEVEGDDGYRLLINGKEVLNAWTKNRWGAQQYHLDTAPGKTYQICLEFWQGDGKANIRLSAGNYQKTDEAALVSRIKDADAIIYVGGISPQLEGEEMQVNYPGFKGGDRTSIQLPSAQTSLLKTLQATGKPVVFVIMTGSALAIPWEAEHIPAIVNAWYGGQAAGTAVADVLFGDYNPAGRLPVTFYKSDDDLPDFTDYSMNNRTYRYFKGTPLYGFGYGLSYTTFKYDHLVMPTVVKPGKAIPISLRITNTGPMAGDEVVQIYVKHENQRIKVPLKALKGFTRLFLKAGERRIINFNLSRDDLTVTNVNGGQVALKGKMTVSAGGSQPDEKNNTSGNIVQQTVTIL